MYEKYAFIATGIVAYSDAGPESGNVPPILMEVAVTPASVDAVVAVDAVIPSDATSASAMSMTLRMNLSLGEVKLALTGRP
jgi:hypothetical protein